MTKFYFPKAIISNESACAYYMRGNGAGASVPHLKNRTNIRLLLSKSFLRSIEYFVQLFLKGIRSKSYRMIKIHKIYYPSYKAMVLFLVQGHLAI